MLNINISYYTSIGGRPKNEDTIYVSNREKNILAMIADGLGGHDNGEIASRLALDQVERQLSANIISQNILEQAIQHANREIRRHQIDYSSMRTTIAVLWFSGNQALAANVGDTRIYQFRDERICYQSIDHSLAQISVMVGEIKQEELRLHQDRNKLVRALGAEDIVKIDIEELDIKSEDSLLICSDGFWELITEDEMIQTQRESHTRNAEIWISNMRQLVEQRISTKGDNHSAIAIMIN